MSSETRLKILKAFRLPKKDFTRKNTYKISRILEWNLWVHFYMKDKNYKENCNLEVELPAWLTQPKKWLQNYLYSFQHSDVSWYITIGHVFAISCFKMDLQNQIKGWMINHTRLQQRISRMAVWKIQILIVRAKISVSYKSFLLQNARMLVSLCSIDGRRLQKHFKYLCITYDGPKKLYEWREKFSVLSCPN